MYMFCSSCSIVPLCGCYPRSIIWLSSIVLFTGQKGCERVSFIVGAQMKGLVFALYDLL